MSENVRSVTAIRYGESVLAESSVFKGGAGDKYLPISFTIYLLRTDSHLILVDAGCDTMPGFVMKNFYSPSKVLKEHGVASEEITDVIITHAHHDHIEAVPYFKNAVIHIQQAEYENGRKYIPDDFMVDCFEDTCVVAGCVKAVKIAGHSKGSCIVLFEMNGKKYVITGDECYARANLEKKIPTGASVCPEKSREFVEKYGTGEYEVLLCHES